MVGEFVKDRTGLDGRIGTNWLASLAKFTGFYVDPWVRALEGGEFASANREDLINTFNYLEFCLTQVRPGLGPPHCCCCCSCYRWGSCGSLPVLCAAHHMPRHAVHHPESRCHVPSKAQRGA
jgi:hypothetical protein